VPALTVVIPAYNRSRLLRCALTTVQRQTFQDYDVWVVGDACTDDTEAVVASFNDPRFQFTNLPARYGNQSGPNNEGIRRARGEFIAQLGNDDLWLPWHLQSLVETAAREQADFAYAGVIFLGPEGPREAYGNDKTRAQVSVAPPPGWMYRRTIPERCGPWRHPDEEPIGVDVGFQARAFSAGFRFAPTRQFSVLKFPSPWWRSYADDADVPQERLLAQMEQDPVALHGRVLTALAFAYAKRLEEPTVGSALRWALRAAERQAGEWYGVDRWPLSAYLRARSARRRRQSMFLRGLGKP
jgi:glycosyltransferase involved in cell wall biosynthesis